MQKFYAAHNTVRDAVHGSMQKTIKGLRLGYSKEIYDQIFDKLELKKNYLKSNGESTNELNIIDYNVRVSPMTYYLNKLLKPKHHLIYPDGKGATKFWDRIMETDDELINVHIMKNNVTTTIKANLLTQPLKDKLIEPKYLPEPTNEEISKYYLQRREPLNNSLLFIGDFVSVTNSTALRTCIYYNEVKTSMFSYGGIKFLAWTTPNEILKYLGPMGSIHRRTNSLMANLYSDIKVIACSDKLKNAKAQRLFAELDDYIKLPTSEVEGEICLIELQSNCYKFNIKFHDELHLIIHKLLCAPGAILRDKLHVLGPGAEDYLKDLIPIETLNKKMSMITEQEFVDLSEVYYYWPFKPDTSIETFSTSDTFFDTID